MDKRLGVAKEGWTIYDEPMPVVTETMHMGTLRSHCTEESAGTENIKKSKEDSLQPDVLRFARAKWLGFRNLYSASDDLRTSVTCLWP